MTPLRGKIDHSSNDEKYKESGYDDGRCEPSCRRLPPIQSHIRVALCNLNRVFHESHVVMAGRFNDIYLAAVYSRPERQ